MPAENFYRKIINTFYQGLRFSKFQFKAIAFKLFTCDNKSLDYFVGTKYIFNFVFVHGNRNSLGK